jgi:hypothetical protein
MASSTSRWGLCFASEAVRHCCFCLFVHYGNALFHIHKTTMFGRKQYAWQTSIRQLEYLCRLSSIAFINQQLRVPGHQCSVTLRLVQEPNSPQHSTPPFPVVY